MHSYLQRHIRTHGNATAAADGVSVKASVGGVTTTTTLLSPITLESSGHQGSLIVSQPALNIPPNTSQNYFMIQTSSGLQLIPLSSPTPPPPQPPPPPPPSQPQNFYLLQCPSNSGGQSNLILVPTANSSNPPPPPQDNQTLPVLQTFQALQSVLNQPQTHVTQFTTMPPPQQQQQQTRIIITNNNQQAAPPTLLANSLLTKPILGRSTRTTRSRRGRKPKASLPKLAAFPCEKDANDHLQAPNCEALANATTDAHAHSSPPVSTFAPSPHRSTKLSDSVSMMSSSASEIPSAATSVTSAVVTEPRPPVSDTATPECRAQEVLGATQTGDTLSGDSLAGKQFVLCFDNQAREMEELKLGEGGESYVLQFETDGRGKEDKDKVGVMSLLHDWGEKKQTGRQEKVDGGQAESYVLHFHTDASGGSGDPATAGTFSQELDGREVVFELGDGDKMEQEAQEHVQMIALIEGRGEEEVEGALGGEAAGAGVCSGAGEGVREERAGVEGIFQLGSGEEIVIIEVSTSSLRRGDSGGEVLHDGAEAEVKEKMAKGQRSAEDTEERDSLAEDDQGPTYTQPRDAVL